MCGGYEDAGRSSVLPRQRRQAGPSSLSWLPANRSEPFRNRIQGSAGDAAWGSIVARRRHSACIWDLRKRISVGTNHFDDTIAREWESWSPILKHDFIATVGMDAFSLDAHAYLDAFPLALKCADWRDALAAELSQRDRSSWTYPMIEGIWELALERFERSPVHRGSQSAALSINAS